MFSSFLFIVLGYWVIDLQTAHILSGMQAATSSLVGSIKDGSETIGAGVGGGLNTIGLGLGVGLTVIGISIALGNLRPAPTAQSIRRYNI